MAMRKYVLAVLLLLFSAVVPALAQPVVVNTATVTADNQATGTGNGSSSATVAVLAAPVPTLSEAGLATLAVLLAGYGVVRMRRRTRRA